MIKTKDIGKLDGELLVFGGPYSNLEALVAMRALAEERGFLPKNIICTGDIIAYCADPVACIELIEDWGIHCIAGNVELNLRDESDECGCNFSEGSRCDVLSQQWYPFAKKSMTESALRYIAQLPEYISFNYAGKKAVVIHGSLENTSEFIFPSTATEIKEKNFNLAEADLIFAGHCGIPFQQKIGSKFWVNAGVIGMPANDGTPNTWFAYIDSIDGDLDVRIEALHYDHLQASHKMLAHNLPETYASTLRTGIWDNCEILPDEETSQQGQSLNFSKISTLLS